MSYLLCTQVIKPQIIHKPQNQKQKLSNHKQKGPLTLTIRHYNFRLYSISNKKKIQEEGKKRKDNTNKPGGQKLDKAEFLGVYEARKSIPSYS